MTNGYNFDYEIELGFDKETKEVKDYIIKAKEEDCYFVFNKEFTKGKYVYKPSEVTKLCTKVIDDTTKEFKEQVLELFHLVFKKKELNNLKIYGKTYDVHDVVKFEENLTKTSEGLVGHFEISSENLADSFGSNLLLRFTSIDLDAYSDYQITNRYYKHFNIDYVSASPRDGKTRGFRLTLGLNSEYFLYHLVKNVDNDYWEVTFVDTLPKYFSNDSEFLRMFNTLKEDFSRFMCNGRFLVKFSDKVREDYGCVIQELLNKTEYQDEDYHRREYKEEKERITQLVYSILEEHPHWKETKESLEKDHLDTDKEECCERSLVRRA